MSERQNKRRNPMPKYKSLIAKGDAIAQRFPEKRPAWTRFKESDAVNETRILAAMVEHLAEYERRAIMLSAEGAKEYAALRQN